MHWNIRSIVVLMSMMALSCAAHASEKSVLGTHGDKNLTEENEDKKALNEAIKIYLDKNSPDEISKLMYSAIEKAQPTSIPESDREKALIHFKKNVTPEVLTKMISAGLKRNFSAEEVYELSKYNDSQLNEDLKKKNDLFRNEVSSEIGLLLAATSG